jgi:FixJ family two-component response regulator
MEAESRIKNVEIQTSLKTSNKLKHPYEVVVIEDNHLTNTILSKALDSTINSIYNLKQITVKFSSYSKGSDFLAYLKSKDFLNVNLIVFSDYHLEDNITGVEILQNIKQRKVDATVVLMSDSPNQQISVDAMKTGAYCFLSKSNKTPVICSKLLSHLVD